MFLADTVVIYYLSHFFGAVIVTVFGPLSYVFSLYGYPFWSV